VKIEILNLAELDILDGFHFYESQASELSLHFLENIYSDIDSLALNAGIHLKPHKNFHRLLSKKIPVRGLLFRLRRNGFRSRRR
jgi:hypothetical protein